MRFWLSLFLLTPAALAQQHNYWHFQPPPARKFFAGNPAPKPVVIPPDTLHVVAPPKACSIPLTNVLKDRPGLKYHMKKIPRGLAPDEHFQMPAVTLPAPPCDDGKR